MSLFHDKRSIPILTYHSIDNSKSVISVSPSGFKKQMNYLMENGYQTLSLYDTIRHLQQRESLPEKVIIITFDDGYKNNYIHAFPILKKYQFTATIFLATAYCEGTNDWFGQEFSIPRIPMLSWVEIREMSRYGIEFGAHTRSHARLADLDMEKAQEEIVGSKMDIESHLNQPVELFSYPFGSFNEQAKEIVRTVFKGAVSTRLGKVNSESDI